MSETDPLVRNVSDTALWVAVYRARETERPDALFRDPNARRLSGARGEQIAASMPFSDKATWAWVARTMLFDQFIEEQIRAGTDLVERRPRETPRRHRPDGGAFLRPGR